MPEFKFVNETSYNTIDRADLMAYINVSESKETPDWAPLGIGAESGSHSYDWQNESKTDIWGNVYNNMKKPIVSLELDPWPVSGNDKAQKHIWVLGVANQDHVKLSAQDILLVHKYVSVGETAAAYFAERYNASSITINNIGGDGGGVLTDGCTLTCGGERSVGKATLADGTVSYKDGLE